MAGRKQRKSPYTKGMLVISYILATAVLIVVSQLQIVKKQYAIEAAITPAPTLAPPAIYARPTEPLLRVGSIGQEVKALQSRLKELGFYDGDIDGDYGGGTRSAVELFQRQHQLKVDGLAGPETMALLYSDAAKRVVVTPRPTLPAQAGDHLPLLINKANALQKADEPKNLVTLKDVLPESLAILKQDGFMAEAAAAAALKTMLEAAHQDGLTVWQVSEAYRTNERQQHLFDQQVAAYVKEGMTAQGAHAAAQKTVALPGTSEHQTGLSFDITVPGKYFIDTQQSQWLADHCHLYGFIVRYTAAKEEITGYLPEPWHIRYVGLPHSTFMYENNLCLEEYLDLYKTEE